MLVAEVKSVNPRRIQAVSLCVLALVGAEVFVVVYVGQEAGCVILRHEAEFLVCNLLIGRDVDKVVVETVSVDVVGSHIRVVVAAPPGFIDKAEVVAAAVTVGE